MPLLRKRKFSSFRSHRNMSLFNSLSWVKPIMLWGFLLVIFVALIYSGFRLIQDYKHRHWNGKTHFAIAYYAGDQVGYLRLNPTLEEVQHILFPNDTFMDMAFGYGKLKAESLHSLVDQEKIRLGPFLQQTLTNFWGTPTQAYIILPKSNTHDFQLVLRKFLLGGSETNLNAWDRLVLAWFFFKIKSYEVVETDLSTTTLLTKSELADGTEVLVPNYESVDTFASRYLSDRDFLNSTLRWEIFNATNHTGFGHKIARMVGNSGFEVVGTRQYTKETLNSSVIQVNPNAKDRNLVRRLASTLQIPVEITKPSSDRADVVFLVGEDMWENCCTRRSDTIGD